MVVLENYIMTGLPDTFSEGIEYSLYFNGLKIRGLFLSEFDSPPNSWFYLDKYDLIEAGILTSNGKISSNIKKGIPQENLPITTEPGSSSADGSSVTVPPHAESEGNLVWIPTNGGTKYHSTSSCSQMENPIQVSIETAKAYGYTACGRCH